MLTYLRGWPMFSNMGRAVAGGPDTRPETVFNSRNAQPAACRGRDSDKRRAILKSHHLLLPRATPTPWRAGV